MKIDLLKDQIIFAKDKTDKLILDISKNYKLFKKGEL